MPSCDTVPIDQLVRILLFEKVHATGGSLQAIATLAPRPSGPTHRSSIAQSPGDAASDAGGAPPFPLRRWRIVQSQLLSDYGNLGMVSCIPHATAPGYLAVLEQELPTYLSEVAAGQHVPARLQLLDETTESHGQHGALHIFWRLARVEGARHTEAVI